MIFSYLCVDDIYRIENQLESSRKKDEKYHFKTKERQLPKFCLSESQYQNWLDVKDIIMINLKHIMTLL